MSNEIELVEATAWAKRFKVECPRSYSEAIKLAAELDFVVIDKRDDHSFKGDFVWAIIPESDSDFWLDTQPTKKAAIAVCRDMKWRIRR